MKSTRELAPSLSRRVQKADTVTGANVREQIAVLRPLRERQPLNIHKRRALESRSMFVRRLWSVYNSLVGSDDDRGSAAPNKHRRRGSDLDVDSPSDDGLNNYDKPQYTLKSVRRAAPSFLRKVLRCKYLPCSTVSDEYVDIDSGEWDINSMISAYLSFSHRTSYFLLFLVFSLVYYVTILMFALVYYIFSLNYPECVTSAGVEIGTGEGANLFGDSFSLSWNTFSTVGYGSIFPSTGAKSIEPLPRKCMFVGIIGSFESFVGVLYAGFCTAVLFGKVIRSQSQAQIYFSDPLVVRYGKDELLTADPGGIQSDVELAETLQSIEESRENEETKRRKDINIPCPSLEFRLVNRLHDIHDGEIVEAQLDCVAILDNRDLDSMVATDIHLKDNESVDETNRDRQRDTIFHNSTYRQRRVISKVILDANEHPFFRRVWFGRHPLDENSPLLSELARDKIRQNNGYWPPEWNNHSDIRDNLHFRHMLVCFSGTSNANATSVYAQKVYDLVDVNVGYRFVPMNYHTADGELKTDSYLLNAISVQKGGGAEPFLFD